jgi:hypothetical protein
LVVEICHDYLTNLELFYFFVILNILPFMPLLITLLNIYVLNAHFTPGTVLGARNPEADVVPTVHELALYGAHLETGKAQVLLWGHVGTDWWGYFR